MGLFDFLKRRPAPPPAASASEPPPPPFPATVATLTADGVGTLALSYPELDAPPPAGQRPLVVFRFENDRPPSVYFRELTLDGRVVRVLAGQARQETPRTPERVFDRFGEKHPTPAAARQAFERLVHEGMQGFERHARELRLAPASSGATAAASNAELEAVFEGAADAGAGSAAQVYADWLQGKGDRRGELAALLQRGQEAEARAFLEAHAGALLGEVDFALDGELYDFRWRHGFLAGASLKRRGFDGRTVLAELTRDFLALPLARFVTDLRFGLASYESDNDWAATLAAVVASPRGRQVKRLCFDDYTSEDCEISWTAFGDFSPFWAKLPALEWLHLRSGEGGQLGELELPNLKTFIRESGGLGGEELRSIARAKWPRLERLDVWFGREEYGAEGTVELIQPLLDGAGLKALKHLGLVNSELAPALVPAVLRSKVLPQLEVLDLSKGVLMDGDVEPLLAQAGALRHLKRLDLSENLLDESCERLKAALPNVVVDEQRYEDGDEEYRFTAVGE